MAFDPSLVASQSDPSVLRMDHPSHTTYTTSTNQHQPTTASSSSPTSVLGGTIPISAPSFIDVPHPLDPNSQLPTSVSPLQDQNGTPASDEDTAPNSASATPDVDPQILEALRSKDRIYVLKLGETFEALIMERRTRVELTPATSYQRLLVHRCSAYYKLAPENDPVTKGIFVLFTAESRIPDRRICELIPAESTTQPAFKIMRRSAMERRSKPQSHAGSVAGEDVDLSDVEPSESGSLGGRSNVTSSSNKKRMTIEEREAAYNEARSRIFMDFEEKEKGKDKDMSASSSSLSLNGSASTSAGGRSSIGGDTDDAASSPATESEWSAPSGSHSRDKKDGRRGGPVGASASSNRTLRTGGSFHPNGSGGSSRNSRAPSPSFSYASLHDASPTGHMYDPNQHHPSMYYPNQYAYPYSPQGQGPSPPFLAPYPYYASPYNPYPSPPPPMPQHAQHTPSDPSMPSGPEPYSPPLQHQMNYTPHYGWPPHPQQHHQPQLPVQSPHNIHMSLPPPPPQQQPPQQQQNPPQHPMGPPPPQQMQPQSPQYQPFVHPSQTHGYSYPMNGYYAPPPPPQQPTPHGQHMPPPHIGIQQPPQQQPLPQQGLQHQHHPGYDVPRSMNGTTQIGGAPNGHYASPTRNGLGNGVIQPNNNGRTNTRSGPNSNPNGSINGNSVNGGPGKPRAQMPPAGRSAWSYGPGVGNGGYTSASAIPSPGGGEAVGPRFHSQRHPSGSSGSSGIGGGNSRSSHHSDDVSSSSSTTSSSSRRTYTSTTSSQQHPLPARPDWAVGLKAQPTLAAMGGGRHSNSSNSLSNQNQDRTIPPISPPRSNGHNSNGHGSPMHPGSLTLQATDFPPLGGGGQEVALKKTPVVAGAWGQSRPVLSNLNSVVNGNGCINTTSVGNPGSAQHSPVSRQEEYERGVGAVKAGELLNPKLVRRPTGAGPVPVVNGQGQGPGHHRAQSDRSNGAGAGPVSVGALVGQVSSMSLEENGVIDASASSNITSAPTSVPLPSPSLVVAPAAHAPSQVVSAV